MVLFYALFFLLTRVSKGRQGVVCGFTISIFSLFFPFSTDAYVGSIIKFPPGGEKTQTYHDLICTDQDKAIIYELITTMAENRLLSLLLKKDHLEKIGEQINHVHPLKFLSTIFTNPRLKTCINDIFNDRFKKNGLMEGLGPSLEREARKGKLDPFIVDFSREVNVSPDSIRSYFQTRDWEELLYRLML